MKNPTDPNAGLLPPGVLQAYSDAYRETFQPYESSHLPAHIAGLKAALALVTAPAAAGAGLREALDELIQAADEMLCSLPGHWHDDATIRLTDAANDARKASKAAAQDDLYEPAASPAGAGTVGGERERVATAICDGFTNGNLVYGDLKEGFKLSYLMAADAVLALTAPPAAAETVGEDEVERVAEALRAADWSGVSIGNKALISAAIAALATHRQSAQAGAGERVWHVKRGTEYEVIGEAEAQVSKGAYSVWPKGIYPMSEAEAVPARMVSDGHMLTVYRCGKTRKLWCRFTDEFRDGRFDTAAPIGTGNGELDHGTR